MKRCLVIKLGALGDVIMATALLHAIRDHHRADGELRVLTTPAFEPLFSDWPGVQTIAFPRHGGRATLAVVRYLRKARFDRIYDLQGSARTSLWCALSGAGERVGNHNRYPYTHHPASRWRGQVHVFERMREVLASAGVTGVPPRPVLPASAGVRRRVADWLVERRMRAGEFALLHAGSSVRHPGKRWPHFAGLAARLAARALTVVWIGGEADRSLNASLAAHCGVDATGAFSVHELAEVGRHARFAVTNDSAPMHILSASGIPVFGLFGPSDWRRNHALDQGARALACVDFDPAHRGEAAAECIGAIAIDDVCARLEAEDLLPRAEA